MILDVLQYEHFISFSTHLYMSVFCNQNRQEIYIQKCNVEKHTMIIFYLHIQVEEETRRLVDNIMRDELEILKAVIINVIDYVDCIANLLISKQHW